MRAISIGRWLGAAVRRLRIVPSHLEKLYTIASRGVGDQTTSTKRILLLTHTHSEQQNCEKYTVLLTLTKFPVLWWRSNEKMLDLALLGRHLAPAMH